LVVAKRSGIRYPGRPISQLGSQEGQHPTSAGIQLFFAGMRDTRTFGSTDLDAGESGAAREPSSPAADLHPRQLRLAWVPADLRRVKVEDAVAAAFAERPDLVGSIHHFGQGRGWSRQTMLQVQRSVAALLSARCGPDQIDESALSALNELGLPTGRAIEFLESVGISVIDPRAMIDCWIQARISHLPGAIKAEVNWWIRVLQGRSDRRAKPVKTRTIKVYLQACLPSLGRWASRYSSLRQVTEQDVELELVGLCGWGAVNTLTGLRSLFRTLKANRAIFADPASSVRVLAPPHRAPLGLDRSVRKTLLDHLERADHRLIVVLAGIHALSNGQIIALRLEDLDLRNNRLLVKGSPRPLDALTRNQLDAWLTFRRARWPRTANPHLLVTPQSANNLEPVGRTYLKSAFKRLPVTASKLRIDRLVCEAIDSRGDALRISLLFGMSPEAAAGYAVAFSELDDIRLPTGQESPNCG